MNDIDKDAKQPRRTRTLRWAIGVDAVIGYILVPFFVVLNLVIPKKNKDTSHKGIKYFGRTWVKSIGVAVSTGALLGTVEWLLERLLKRRLLDGMPAVATGVGIPALMGSWLIDKKNRLRGAGIAVLAMLPRIILSESWRRDYSTDEEFDREMSTAREQLFSVLKEEAERRRAKYS